MGFSGDGQAEQDIGSMLVSLRITLSRYARATCALAQADHPPGQRLATELIDMATAALAQGADSEAYRLFTSHKTYLGHAAQFHRDLRGWFERVTELYASVVDILEARQRLANRPLLHDLLDHPVFTGGRRVACQPTFRVTVMSPLIHALTRKMRMELRHTRQESVAA